ncbi:MAG: helicase C-terminal domain-containing protein [Planctomycetota bacterium]|jgi:Rad3-related DNA helicase
MEDPKELGLPLETWREGQVEAIENILATDVLGYEGPTGFGKTAVYMAVALKLAKEGKRTVILTATKRLQDQIARDYGPVFGGRAGRVAVMKGKANYNCEVEIAGYKKCVFGQCKRSECEYKKALREALRSKIVVTNYSYWLATTDEEGSLFKPDFLVCDEVHNLHKIVLKTLQVSIKGLKLKVDPLKGVAIGWVLAEQEKAFGKAQKAKGERGIAAAVKRGLKLRKLGELLTYRDRGLCELAYEEERELIYTSDPKELLSPGAVTGGVEKVLFMSATLPHWIKSWTTSAVKRQRSTFDLKNRAPVYYLAGSPTLNYRSGLGDWGKVAENIVKICATRGGRNGVVHVNSYAQAQTLFTLLQRALPNHAVFSMQNSIFGASTFEIFQNCEQPAVLITPVMKEGMDFAGDTARFQVIAKIPFANPHDQVNNDHCKAIRGMAEGEVLLAMQQMIGRIMRGPGDWGETFILDSAWLNVGGGRPDRTRTVSEIPDPLDLEPE